MTDQRSDSEWTKVVFRKHRQDRPPDSTQESRIKAIKHYWDGFDNQGCERWYIELSNGAIISNTDKEYGFWIKRYYPNRT